VVATRGPGLIRLTVALVAAVFVADLLWGLVADSTGSLAYALVDEPAHLATCAVALLALVAAGAPVSRRFAVAALLASTAIDLDHLPGYLGSHLLMASSMPRPYSHSVLTVASLLALGLYLRGDRREISFGLAFGVTAHLCRDLATGPGIPLLWPLAAAPVTVPYAVYAAVLLIAGAGVAISARHGLRRRPGRRRLGARPLPSGGRPGGS
jgi:inner membrane protein